MPQDHHGSRRLSRAGELFREAVSWMEFRRRLHGGDRMMHALESAEQWTEEGYAMGNCPNIAEAFHTRWANLKRHRPEYTEEDRRRFLAAFTTGVHAYLAGVSIK